MLIDIAAAETVILVTSAVFRDPQGAGQNFLQFCGAFGNAGRIDLPIQVVTGAVLPDAVTDAGDSGAGVIVDAVKVRILSPGQMGKIAQGKRKFAQAHSFEQSALEQILRKLGADSMENIFFIFRSKDPQMVGNTHFGIGVAHGFALTVKNGIGPNMAIGHIFHDPDSIRQGGSSGRPHAEHEGIGGVYIGFIDGDIIADQVAEAVNG